ncbi:MAG: hypothetical protein ACUVTX_03760 [Bacteroidales bacterium]
MKKLILILSTVFCFSILLYGQDYNTGIGLRLGYFNGITVKHFIHGTSAIEGLLYIRWKGFEVTGLYEVHTPAFQTAGLNWFFGGGAHIGFYNGDNTPWGDVGATYTNIGIDGIVGLEYNFSKIPLNLSLDWKPELNIIGYREFWYDNVALSVRFVF